MVEKYEEYEVDVRLIFDLKLKNVAGFGHIDARNFPFRFRLIGKVTLYMCFQAFEMRGKENMRLVLVPN